MKLALVLIALILGPWLVLGMLFLAYPTVRRLKDRRDEFGWIIKIPAYTALVLGLLANVAFNVLWGSVIFREPPKEWLFSDRLKRHYRGADTEQSKRAEPWVRRVNAIDPGHV